MSLYYCLFRIASVSLHKILFNKSHIRSIFRNVTNSISLKLLFQFVVGSFSWLNSGMKLVSQLEFQQNTEMRSQALLCYCKNKIKKIWNK